jgi:hypothetical protein
MLYIYSNIITGKIRNPSYKFLIKKLLMRTKLIFLLLSIYYKLIKILKENKKFKIVDKLVNQIIKA